MIPKMNRALKIKYMVGSYSIYLMKNFISCENKLWDEEAQQMEWK